MAFLWPLLQQNCSLLPPSSSPPLLLNTTCPSLAVLPWTVGWEQFWWFCWSTWWPPVLGWRRTLRTTHRIPSCWTPAGETLAGHEKQPAGHEDQPSGQPPASLPGLGAGHPPAQLADKTPDRWGGGSKEVSCSLIGSSGVSTKIQRRFGTSKILRRLLAHCTMQKKRPLFFKLDCLPKRASKWKVHFLILVLKFADKF